MGNKGATGDVANCAALNPAIICDATKQEFGRVAGNFETNLSNNIGFINMLNPDGNILWLNERHDKYDGAGISAPAIHADGTLGGRFTDANGWITQNGKLPGLFGQTVDMPIHLGGVGIVEMWHDVSVQVYPNPTNGQLTIDNGELTIDNVKIYDVMGKTLNNYQLSIINCQLKLDISHLPAGVYFIRIQMETEIITKKVVKQ